MLMHGERSHYVTHVTVPAYLGMTRKINRLRANGPLTIRGRAAPPQTMNCRLAPTLFQRARERTCSANLIAKAAESAPHEALTSSACQRDRCFRECPQAHRMQNSSILETGQWWRAFVPNAIPVSVGEPPLGHCAEPCNYRRPGAVLWQTSVSACAMHPGESGY